MDARDLFDIGETLSSLDGYGGYFKRLYFGDYIVEAVGKDWVVVRDEDEKTWFESFENGINEYFADMVWGWKNEAI